MLTEINRNIDQMKKIIILLGIASWWAMPKIEAQTQVTDTVFLQIYMDNIHLDEVLVKGKKTPATNSRWSDMLPVDLVTTGGANGDLYKALQTLPGTQVQGESGKLLVRGGSSYETQTYMDGMHVLNPYTSNAINSPARSRYSTFMFSGINLASGGASQEYGEALSAILPLETKDHSPISKLGINASIVGLGGGGTHAWDNASLSVDLNYQNLGLHNRIYSGRILFEKPYQIYSGATQFRYTPNDKTLLKVYAQYDRTDFSANEGEERRLFVLGEDNTYLNAIFRRSTSKEWHWFGGVAYSSYEHKIEGVSFSGDYWRERQQELHLKTKASKRILPKLRLDMGLESFIRRYHTHYQCIGSISKEEQVHLDKRNCMNSILSGGFLSGTYYPIEKLKAELSFRTEYSSLNRRANFSPRLALHYQEGDLLFSAIAGRYTQLPESRFLVQEHQLKSEVCNQYILGIQQNMQGRFYKAELYYKAYGRLVLLDSDEKGGETVLTSNGYGYSKGLDLFFCDSRLLKHFEYQVSYTYNIARRKYQEYAELTTPQYATLHNAAVVFKYSMPRWRTIIGLTDCLSSGRPYHNPNLPGLMNDEVKPYNSLDLGLTFLPSQKVIIHASATNILCRKNEFGRVNGLPVRASSDHFFYIGLFVTLGKKSAYDVSNF